MRIAITDGYSNTHFLADKLHAAGAELIHVRSHRDFPELMYRSFHAENFIHDLGYVADTVALVEQLRSFDVTAVIAGTESGVPLSDTLTDALGLPGNSPATSASRRSKAEMGSALRAAGLDYPHGMVVSSTDEALAWLDASGLTEVVVKPLDSAGTDHVRICRSPTELTEATSAILAADNFFGTRNEKALVQEYLTGREYYVNSVSVDGTHKIAETWRYSKHRTTSGAPIYDYEEPADGAAPQTRQIHSYLRRALDALGIENGAAHSELMLTERGPVLIECGARMCGGVQPWISEQYSGISHVALLATYLLDRTGVLAFDDTSVRFNRHVRNLSLINHQEGAANGTDWIAKMQSLDTVIGVFTGVTPGAPLTPTCDVVSSPGYVYVASENLDDLERDYRTIREWERTGLYT